jgi:serine/threonine protein kinase/formylglycine-generating enzyme required for sulfatase activity
MAQLNKGSLLLRCAAHALQVGLKEIPGVGAVVELGYGWFEIFRSEYHKANFQERILQLEGAPAISPKEARVIAGEVIKAKRLAGAVISEEKAEAIADLLAFVPATIKERTRATLHQAKQRGTALQTVLPVADDVNPTEQEAFYRSLLPARRPRFQVGQVVPNANPNWHLTEFLATGGFGEVWEVQHARLRFAIKFCLDQASAKALKREAEALFTLREQLPEHPHIVRLVDINLTAEPYWLAFDFVDGGTLEALMRAAPLDWQESLNWFRPIVEAVAAVHRINIVHRDLKPANILLTTDGVPKIADFGIGKITAENETVMRATRNQYTLLGAGSSGYMSREQCLGLPAHPTDDIYALGVMLWQMLTHRLEAPDLQMVMELQQLEVPQALKTVLLECLTQPREYRPADASVLLAMLPSQAGGSLQEELAALNQQLAELQAQEAQAAQHSEAAEQRELARQRLQKQEEIARKQRQVNAEAARQQVYETALVDDRAEQAEMNEQAKARLEARLAELRQLVEQKHQRGGAPQPLQSAITELQQVDELIKKTEADYAQEQTTQREKNQAGLQKALVELGEFKSAPRDRFEKTKEYEQRVVREKAEYATQQEKIRTSWQEAWKKLEKQIAEARLQNLEVLQKQRTALLNQEFDIPPAQLVLQLIDYDADEELMQFEIIAEETMPGERYRTQGATLSIAPQEAKICWQRWEQDRQLLVPYFLLGLDAEAKPKLIAAGFETAEGQRYCVSAALQVEPSTNKEAEQRIGSDESSQSQVIPVEQNETHVHTKTFDFEIVIVNAKGEIIQRESKQAQCEIEDLGNGVTLEMVSIPGGTFMMGSPENEKERESWIKD